MGNHQPILSICIPIYNRLNYLEKMLARFTEDKDLFEEQIHLFISDNCSEDDLQACCEKYSGEGLKIEYVRNEENIGADKNFEQCFARGKGKYTWLLGSDDIPVRGYLRKLLGMLSAKDYGLFHLSLKKMKEENLKEFVDCNNMLEDININLTFMSSNIVASDKIRVVDLAQYRNTNLIQICAYLTACTESELNAVSYLGNPFEPGSDIANNGGFNFYRVFVENFYKILNDFVGVGKLNTEALERVKRKEFKNYLCRFFVRYNLLHLPNNYDFTDSSKILKENYGFRWYIVWDILTYPIGVFHRKVRKELFMR